MVRRSVVVLVCAVVCLWAGVLIAAPGARAAGSAAGPVRDGGDTWTVALYVNADNDLAYAWPRFTLPALQRIPASPNLNVVALLDKKSKTGSFLYRISGSQVTTVRHWTAERDFGKGATFQWFLKEVHQRFPSDHLIVIGWDHGYGWRYFSHDYNADDAITMPELRTALRGAGVPVDILAFDACNMGDAEVAWDVASVDDPSTPGSPLVDYLVASEETVDQDGYPYDTMFAPLAADPGRSPVQVTDDMLRGWDTYYGSLRCFDWVSLSAVDLAAVRAAGPAVADLAGRLSSGLAASPSEYGQGIARAVRSSLAAWDSWQLDLGMFAGRIVDGHDFDFDPGLVAAAQAVRDAEATWSSASPAGPTRAGSRASRSGWAPARTGRSIAPPTGSSRCSAPRSGGRRGLVPAAAAVPGKRPGRPGRAAAGLAACELRPHGRLLQRPAARLGDRLRQRQERERRPAHDQRRQAVEDGAAV